MYCLLKTIVVTTTLIIEVAALIMLLFVLALSNSNKSQTPLSQKAKDEIKTTVNRGQATFQKINEKYCVTYGDAKAPVKVIEFFSLQCPHCIRLFRSDFQKIQNHLIDKGKVQFTFHPVPQDLATVQAMICCEQLNESEKRLFLEAMFEECEPADSELMLTLMIAAMNVFKKPLATLGDETFLKNHHVLDEVYAFLKQEKIFAVPAVEVNGQLFTSDVPSYSFINSLIKD